MAKNGEKQEIVEGLVNILNEKFREKGYIAKSHENLIRTLRADQIEDEDAVRGKNAFQTDILIYKKDGNKTDSEVPVVVIELKTGHSKEVPTTHDIILYSVKAMKHKSAFPQLRYGMVWFNGKKVPNRFILNNEYMDFAYGFSDGTLSINEEKETFLGIVREQLKTAERTLERLENRRSTVSIFSSTVRYE